MNRVLVDANVILDVLLERHPHDRASSAVWAAAERGEIHGMVAGHAVTTIHYLYRKEKGVKEAKRVIAAILRVFATAAVTHAVLADAMTRDTADFEDAVSASAAEFAGCETIVTRDPKGFRGSALRVLQPEMLLDLIGKVN